MKRELVLAITFILIVSIFLALVLSVHAAPQFTLYMLLLLLATFLYLLTEQWITHAAGEFENRFWTIMAFCMSFICLFCEDSPLQFSGERRGLAWCIVCLMTYLCHIYDRDVRRVFLTRATNIGRIRSADFNIANRANAKQKALDLKKYVQAIDQRWMSSFFQNIFFLPHVLYVEHMIYTVLAEANADELNLIISDDQVELALILYKVKDHWVSRRFNRSKILELLAKERAHELTVRAKARLLDAFQKLKLSAHPLLEHYVLKLFQSTKGDELSALKCITDSKGDIYSLHHLVYTSLRDPAIKAALLHHIEKEARILASHILLNTRTSKRKILQFAWKKILSDVDDTLTCSMGSWPAGMDTSLPKGSLYPGVLAFYKELDLGAKGQELRDGNLVFLSARPHVYKNVSEAVTYTKVQTLKTTRGLHASATLLAGDLDTGRQYMLKNDAEPLAQKKYENFKEYCSLYPEYHCIFIGDNGQGDVRAMELVMDDSDAREYLDRSYIHIVQPLVKMHVRKAALRRSSRENYLTPGTIQAAATGVEEQLQEEKSNSRKSFYYFTTYVDAAIDAHRHKLISLLGLQRVMLTARSDLLEKIGVDSWQLMNPVEYKSLIFVEKGQQGGQPAVAAAAGHSSSQQQSRPSSSLSSHSQSQHSSLKRAVVASNEQQGIAASSPQQVATAGSSSSRASEQPPNSSKAQHHSSLRFFGSSSFSSSTKQPSSSEQQQSQQQPSPGPGPVGSSSSRPSSLHSNPAATALSQKTTTSHHHNSQQILLTMSLAGQWEIIRNQPAFYRTSSLASIHQRKLTGLGKRELRIREVNQAIRYGNQLLEKHREQLVLEQQAQRLRLQQAQQAQQQAQQLSSSSAVGDSSSAQQQQMADHQASMVQVPLLPYPQMHHHGKRVKTPFGIGCITLYREEEGIYEITISNDDDDRDHQLDLLQLGSSLSTPMASAVATTTHAVAGGGHHQPAGSGSNSLFSPPLPPPSKAAKGDHDQGSSLGPFSPPPVAPAGSAFPFSPSNNTALAGQQPGLAASAGQPQQQQSAASFPRFPAIGGSRRREIKLYVAGMNLLE